MSSNFNFVTRIDDLMMAVVLEESQGHISDERLHALQWKFNEVKSMKTELERPADPPLVRKKSTVWHIPTSPESDQSHPLNGGEDVSMEDVEKYLDHNDDDDATTEPMLNEETDSQDQKPLVGADTRKCTRNLPKPGPKGKGKREGNKGKAKVGNCRLKSKQPDSKARSKS